MPDFFYFAALLIAGAAASATPDAILETHRTSGDRPGVSAAIVIDGELSWSGAAGFADLENDRPMTADTPLYAGSLSKVFTAVIALGLVEDGVIGLDDALDLGDGLRPTPRQLLSHAAGLPREGDFGYWWSGIFPDRSRLAGYLANLAPRQPADGRYSYSNIGYAALGLGLEAATGRSYAELLENRLIEPLSLEDTGTGDPPAALARGYTPAGRVLPSESRPFAGVGNPVGERRLREYHRARAMTPAFGVHSSSHDLARLGAFLVGTPTAKVAGASRRGDVTERQASGWGLGMGIAAIDGRTVARHGGWFAAHRSALILDPDSKVAIAVMTNSDDGEPGRLATALYRYAMALE